MLPQYRHLRTVLRSSSTIQVRAAKGSQGDAEFGPGVPEGVRGGRKDLRAQLVHVRTMGVERIYDVMEHRAMNEVSYGE